MDIQQAIGRVVEHLDLTRGEMAQVMRQIMSGQCTSAQIAGLLIGLRMKSESIEEITGAVEVMRELATPVSVKASPLVDIVGTGGDGANLFNVSSAAAFATAACGAHVAKHGNRAVSSSSGSADLLERAGIQLALKPEAVARCIEEVGLGFIFAPGYHGAMKHAVGVRRELGQRTLFNILGPLTNPAGVQRLVLGVFNARLCRPLAEVLGRLGAEHVMVVHGRDGLDEISLAAPTEVAEFHWGELREYSLTPEELGIDSQSLVGLEVEDAAVSLALIEAALSGSREGVAAKAADMIALNAGAAVYVAGLAPSHREGVALAAKAMAAGRAAAKLRELADFSAQFQGAGS